ncbi:MAG: hypothetical protein EP341_09720 [Sphingomonadales bacterium]|nr:MAG: hypothetical protein EP341_09720 [Sphingomonadales bacterium]
MGKRSNFKRRPQDRYRTFDPRAGDALAPHIHQLARYWEPCAAAGDLVRNLNRHGMECIAATDISPECDQVYRLDALKTTAMDVAITGATHIITNPPWSRPILHQMIPQFAQILPTWLLFDADWAHTMQAAPLMRMCKMIVSVGRLCWIEGTTQTGKDNCAWYHFDARHQGGTQFIGR